MKIHCRNKEMGFSTGYCELVVKNYTATVTDQIGQMLIVQFPRLFSTTAFKSGEKVATEYRLMASPPPVEADAPESEG